MSNLVTSPRGINLIKKWEGYRAEVYLCPAKKLTVGWGHLIRPSDNLSIGSGITLAQAEVFLKNDMHLAELFINAVLSPAKINGHPLNQNEFDALVCFCFNLGVGALDGSTLLKKLQAGDCIGAANEFGRWVYMRVNNSKAIYSKGLYKRRMEEQQLFKEIPNAQANA